jgi:segregation and condensation protein B
LDEERLKAILESLLFAAGEPVSLNRLAAVIDSVPKEEIRNALAALGSQYAQGGRGLTVEEVAGGYQLRTRKEFAPQIRKLLAGKPPRLSRSLLETLAIVAYRQPVTRPEIEQVRGVDCGGVLETLLERRLVKIGGRKEAPGRPMLYETTGEFLEVFSLKDLDSLPDLKEFQEIQRAQEESESQGVETVTEMRDIAAAFEAEGAEAGAEVPGEQLDSPPDLPLSDLAPSDRSASELPLDTEDVPEPPVEGGTGEGNS